MTKPTLILLAALLGTAGTACGDGASGSDDGGGGSGGEGGGEKVDDTVTDYCEAVCECEDCDDEASDKCVDDLGKDFAESDDAGCKPKHAAYLDCLAAEGTCSDGEFVPEAINCENEKTDLDDCVADAD